MGIFQSPREVQLAFLEWLPLCDLITLSVTSKDTRHQVEPLIYSTITMTWTLQNRPPIMLLLRTILDRPELGSYVRRLGLDGEGFRVRPPYLHRTQKPIALPNLVPLPAERLSQVARYTTNLPKIINSWIHEAQSGSSDAVAGFLISLLPNLAWLSFSENWTNEVKYIGLVFGSATYRTFKDSFQPRLPTYESLKHIELPLLIDEEYYLDPLNTPDVLSLFYLPNIEHVSVSIGNPVEFSWPSSTPPNPLLLSSLDLGRIREICLEPLLSIFKNLRKIRYNWYYQENLDRKASDHIVRLDTMAAALAGLSGTLTELEITADSQPAYSWGKYEPPKFILQGSLSQLSQLHRLRQLHVPWLFVMGMTESSPGRLGPILPGRTYRVPKPIRTSEASEKLRNRAVEDLDQSMWR